MLALVRKELRVTFNSPVAYIVISGFLVFTAGWFFLIFDFFGRDVASLRGYFGIMPVVFVVLVPAVTMRTWAEERASGTEETLLTDPLSEAQLVTGKYLAVLVVLWTAIALTLFVPLTVGPLGDFERGEILGQYVGLLLMSASSAAIGQLVSSLARNQISAFILTALVLLALVLVGELATVAWLPRSASAVARYLSIEYHVRGFNRGLLDTRDVVFFVALSAVALFATSRVLVLRKYR